MIKVRSLFFNSGGVCLSASVRASLGATPKRESFRFHVTFRGSGPSCLSFPGHVEHVWGASNFKSEDAAMHGCECVCVCVCVCVCECVNVCVCECVCV